MKLGASPLLAALSILTSLGCSSTTTDPASVVGGVVVGATDAHCAKRSVGISDPAICQRLAGASSSNAAGAGGSADSSSAGGAAPSEAGAGTGGADCSLVHDAGYGDTLYNDSGDDDDCKYHMTWSSTPIRKGQSVTLTVTATSKTTGALLDTIPDQMPGAPALSRIEPYMPCKPSHLAPRSSLEAPVTRLGPGKFSVGPVLFDESGRWIVRFHYYELCFDAVTSPHAHIAFFVDVP